MTYTDGPRVEDGVLAGMYPMSNGIPYTGPFEWMKWHTSHWDSPYVIVVCRTEWDKRIDFDIGGRWSWDYKPVCVEWRVFTRGLNNIWKDIAWKDVNYESKVNLIPHIKMNVSGPYPWTEEDEVLMALVEL